MLPPPLPAEIQYRKLKRELSGFAIFLGLLLLVSGYFLYTGIRASAPPILGFARGIAWGVPVMVVGAINLTAGILLVVTSGRLWVYLMMVGGVLLALDYCTIMVLSTGAFPVNLMTFAILAVPFLVIQRALMFLRMHRP